jgi:hypothetical protein
VTAYLLFAALVGALVGWLARDLLGCFFPYPGEDTARESRLASLAARHIVHPLVHGRFRINDDEPEADAEPEPETVRETAPTGPYTDPHGTPRITEAHERRTGEHQAVEAA